MGEKVSIIVPVYKTEKYLASCMESILHQDYPEIEVILIDDGSPDNCPALCDKYAEKNSFVRVLHRDNQGAGASRNAGMDIATGKYVCFVDSDDCLDGTHAITTLVQCAEAENADVVVGNYRQLTEQFLSELKSLHRKNSGSTNTVDFRFKGFFQYGHLGFIWGKCYKKEFLDRFQLRCSTVPFTEDKAMNLCCCACEPKYAFAPESVYLYRLNEESVTSSFHPDLIQTWVSTAERVQCFLEKNKCQDKYWDLIVFHICLGIFTIVQQELRAGNNKIFGTTQKIREYGRIPLVRECIKDLAKGKYVCHIHAVLWKMLIWGASVLFTLRGYGLMSLGFWVFHVTKLDEKIIAFKYTKGENK